MANYSQYITGFSLSILLLSLYFCFGSLVIIASIGKLSLTKLATAPLIGLSITVLAASWSTWLNVSIWVTFLVLTVILSLVWFFRTLRNQEVKYFRLKFDLNTLIRNQYLLVTVVLTIVSILVCLFISFDSQQGFTFFASTGPDGLGYAIAAQSVGLNNSIQTIQNNVELQLPNVPFPAILTALTGAIYDIPSFTLQVQTEFLIGAQRVGMASIAGNILKITGINQIWMVQAALVASSFGALIPLVSLHFFGEKFRKIRLSIFSIFIISSPVILYALNEGGIGQIFVIPAFVGFIIAFKRSLTQFESWLIACASSVLMVASYFDGFILQGLFWIAIAGMFVFQIIQRPNNLGSVFLGYLTGAMLAFPNIINLVTSLGARSVDSGQAGWEIPSNLGLPELLNILPFYTQEQYTSDPSILSTQIEASRNTLLWPIVVIITLILLIRLLIQRKYPFEIGLIVTGLVGLAGQFVLTQNFTGGTNYQLFKASVFLVPVLFLGICSISFSLNSIKSTFTKKLVTGSIIVLSLLGSIMFISNGLSWFDNFRKHSEPMPSGLVEAAYSQKINNIFKSFEFVNMENQDGPLPNSFLGTLGDYYLLNRGPGVLNIQENSRGLALIGEIPSDFVVPKDIPRDFLQNNVGNGSISVLDLDTSPQIIDGHTPEEACLIAGLIYSSKSNNVIERCDVLSTSKFGINFNETGSTAKKPEVFLSYQFHKNYEIRMLLPESLQTGNGTIFQSSNDPNGLKISLDSHGKLSLDPTGSVDSQTDLGYVRSSGTSFIRIFVNQNLVTILVNNKPVTIDVGVKPSTNRPTVKEESGIIGVVTASR